MLVGLSGQKGGGQKGDHRKGGGWKGGGCKGGDVHQRPLAALMWNYNWTLVVVLTKVQNYVVFWYLYYESMMF